MFIRLTKTKENRAIANSIAQKKSYEKQQLSIIDNRYEAITQRKRPKWESGIQSPKTIQLAYNPKTFIQNPSYKLRSRSRGGWDSSVVLGGGGYNMQGMGTNADRNRPGGMRRARRQFPGESFKAGHILNAEFGGAGNNNANLMILTAGGNSAHRAFDQPVKRSIHHLYNLLNILYGIHGNIVNTYNCGIEIEVIVDNFYWKQVYTNDGFDTNRQRNAANNIPYLFQGYVRYLDGGTGLYAIINVIANQGTKQTALNHWNAMNNEIATANNVGMIANPRT